MGVDQQISAGNVYLSPMIDCFDGQIVSWSIGARPDAELVNTMLDAGIKTLDSYIRWCDEKRIKISLRALSPVEYRKSLGLAA